MTVDYEYLQQLINSGKKIEALRCAVALMQKGSPSCNLWFELSMACLEIGERDAGMEGLIESGKQFARTGNLPMALVALRIVEEQKGDSEDLKNLIVQLYQKGSQRIRHTTMPVPPLPVTISEKELEAIPLDRNRLIEEAKRVLVATKEAINLERSIQEKEPFLPFFPLFSSLQGENFIELASCFVPKRFSANEIIIKQGDWPDEFYLIASGEVKIFTHGKAEDSQGKTSQMSLKHIATLGPGAFIGEMGIVAKAPRSATVQGVTSGFLLATPIEKIENLAGKIPEIAEIIVAFCEVRLMENVLSGSAVFLPIEPQKRDSALEFFDRLFIPAGEVLIQEGESAKGIYIIVSGEAAVVKTKVPNINLDEKHSDNPSLIYITTLKSGDVAGEISTIMKKPATATVYAITDLSLLFLPANRFLEFTRAYPASFQKLYEVVALREEEIQNMLSRNEILST